MELFHGDFAVGKLGGFECGVPGRNKRPADSGVDTPTGPSPESAGRLLLVCEVLEGMEA